MDRPSPPSPLDVSQLEDRKRKEIEYHDRIRTVLQGYERRADTHAGEQPTDIDHLIRDKAGFDYLFSNTKYYAITHDSERYQQAWMRARCVPGTRVLDFACGSGENAILAAQCGAEVVGIDLSAEGCRNAALNAGRAGVGARCRFEVMDGEHMAFPDASFDFGVEYGALHHVDLDKALPELARVLKPGGEMICVEGLRHNPLIHLYRRLTPHLRTEWEVDHILGVESFDVLRRYFGEVRVTYFHLAVLAAVPLRKTFLFGPVRRALESLDRRLLRNPAVGKYAWIAVLGLGCPRPPR